ncbi:unnamed protein product, partial [Gadus morhua 'NCC']
YFKYSSVYIHYIPDSRVSKLQNVDSVPDGYRLAPSHNVLQSLKGRSCPGFP